MIIDSDKCIYDDGRGRPAGHGRERLWTES